MTPGEDQKLLDRLRAGLGDESLLVNGKVLPERQLAERFGLGRARLRSLLDVLDRKSVV